MSTAEERFQAMMAKRIKNKKDEDKTTKLEKKEIQIKSLEEIFPIDNNVFLGLTTDLDLIEYLKKKSLEMLKIQGNNVILLGKNLTEVFQELGRKGSPEGLYIKYLELNGYKKDTALRLRKRYELFSNTDSKIVKEIISVLPIRSMELLYKKQDKILKKLEENDQVLTYKKMLDIINDNNELIEIKEKNEKMIYNYSVEKIDDLYQKINDRYNELDNKSKEKIDKLLFEIEKILK